MIPPFSPDPTSMYIFIGAVAITLIGILVGISFQNKISTEQYTIIVVITFSITIITGAYYIYDVHTQPNWSDAVLEEIKTQSCDELKADYEAYESVWAKEQTTKEYVMDCVAVEDQMILEMLK